MAYSKSTYLEDILSYLEQLSVRYKKLDKRKFLVKSKSKFYPIKTVAEDMEMIYPVKFEIKDKDSAIMYLELTSVVGLDDYLGDIWEENIEVGKWKVINESRTLCRQFRL